MSLMPLTYGADIPRALAVRERTTMRQLFVTRFMFYASLVVMILFICIGVIMWLELKRPDKDNTALDLGILGFATTNIGVVLLKASQDRQHLVLQEQNLVLDKTYEKVNGGTQKLLEALNSEHELAIAILREEATKERHRLRGELHAEMLKVEHFSTENMNFIETIHQLRARADDLTAKLVECAKQGSKAEGKLEATIEQQSEAAKTHNAP